MDHRANKIVRVGVVENLTGLSKASIYRLMKAGQFPQSVKISERAIGWRSGEVFAWQENRPTSDANQIKSKVK